MTNRTLLSFSAIFIVPLLVVFAACNGGNGEEEDADADQEVIPDVTEDDVQIDPQPDETDEDAMEDPAEEDVDEEEGPSELSIEEYCAGSIFMMCTYVETCCTTEEAAVFSDIDCEDHTNNDMYTECMSYFQPSVDAGRMVLDESAAPDCNSTMMEILASCLDLTLFKQSIDRTGSSLCAGVLQGQVAEDGECTIDADCADGYCVMPDPLGTCAPYVALEGACDSDNLCGPGYACIANACAELSGEGGDCDAEDNGDCQAGFFCDAGYCAALGTAGEECVAGLDTCEGICNDSLLPHECIDYCNGID